MKEQLDVQSGFRTQALQVPLLASLQGEEVDNARVRGIQESCMLLLFVCAGAGMF